jgi:PTH1 family peptidyl-tRNA hydrolase
VSSKLIVGLGNPGAEYDSSRHNIGFAVLDAFGEKHKILGKQKRRLSSWIGKEEVEINGNKHELILAWPTTFMNASGEAVLKLLSFYRVKPKDVIVIHDDVALNLGKIRVGFNSGAGGQHGVESIISHIGNQEFARLRVGVGPDPGGDKRADYVLSKFNEEEKNIVNKVISTSLEAIEAIIEKDVGEAMNKFNGLEIV